MLAELETIQKILFSHDTSNQDQGHNPNIPACQKAIQKYLKSKGINAKIQEYQVTDNPKHKHSNLIAYKPNAKKYILLQGHVDTVPQKAKVKITSQKIIGRGAVDMKGPLAGLIDAFVNLYSEKTNYSPILLITGNEEGNSFAGIKNFLSLNKNLLKRIEFGINGEPSNFAVNTKFYGVFAHSLFIKGLAGHSAFPKIHLIENSLTLAGQIKLFLESSRKIKKDGFGQTVAAFTIFKAGEKANQMPASLEMAWNLRTVEKSEIYKKLFDKLVRPYLSEKAELKKKFIEPSGVSFPNQKLKESLRTAFVNNKLNFKLSVFRGLTESSYLNKAGIPTISFGPGDMTLAHSDDEQILVSDVEKYSKIVKNFFDYL